MAEEGRAMYLAAILAYVLLTVGICWFLALRGNQRSKRLGKGKDKSGKNL